MPYDSLLRPDTRLVGAGGTVNGTAYFSGASGALNTVMDFGGAPIEVESHLRIGGGAPTGTGPTFALKYQESADGSSSWTDVAGGVHPTQSASMQNAPLGGTESGGSADPSRITFRTTKRFVRGFVTLNNADNSFLGVTVGIVPTAGSRPTTGRS